MTPVLHTLANMSTSNDYRVIKEMLAHGFIDGL